MKIDHLSEDQYGFFFDILRSIRYHDRRRAFFESMHRVTSVLNVLLCGSVIFGIAHAVTGDPAWFTIFALVTSLFTAVDLIVGYSTMANRHDGLKRRFCELQMLLESGAPQWEQLNIERLRIENEEPPVYRALDLLCHNEMLVVQGHKGQELRELQTRLHWYERLTCHFFKWSDIGSSQPSRAPHPA